MPALPYLRETPLTEDWSDSEANIYTSVTYLAVGIYLSVLVFSGINFYKFVLI